MSRRFPRTDAEGLRFLYALGMLFSLCSGPITADAAPLWIAYDNGRVIVQWDTSGILQSADEVTGPWADEPALASPYRVTPTRLRQFYRVFYPQGAPSLLEPPEMAPGAPHPKLTPIWQLNSPMPPVHDWSPPLKWVLHKSGKPAPRLFSGEFQHTEVDLVIPGRGLDFVWARKYRSLTGSLTAQGGRWDFSYNVRIERRGPHAEVFDGNGRRDIFFQQPDGSFVADQIFREGRFDPNGVFTLTFADKGMWEFLPLDGRPAQGKISRSADRNGNALAFAYDGLGRLSRVTDTLGRDITVAYNRDGFIESVTDFTGRQVRYAHFQNGDAGGSFGDLKSVTLPAVTGTPNGTDFPAGKTTTYTYTRGFPDERDNHLLLSVTDPKGQTWLENSYGPPPPPPPIPPPGPPPPPGSSCTLCYIKKASYALPGEDIHFEYVSQVPAPSNGQAVIKAIVNDRAGNVSEYSYDAGNRLVLQRDFTGRAAAGQPTTETMNRPTNALRTNDPPFFETRYEWNADSLATHIVFPNGNSVSNTYELALNPGAPRRARANLRVRTQTPGPLGADQAQIVEQFEYGPDFGGCCGFNFVTRHVDARGHETLHAYDERGNRTNTVHRIPSVTEQWEYNPFGQVTAYVAPDNGSGHRARFEGKYYTTGVQHGYLRQWIVDTGSTGLSLATTYEYDAVGNVVRVIDPRGNDALFTYNQLDQLVRAESRPLAVVGGQTVRYSTDYFYDANDNLVRVCRSNHDETGALVPGNLYLTELREYDILNRLVRVCAESGRFDVPRSPPKLDCAGLPASEFVTTEFEHDPNDNLALVRFGEASEGRQPANVVRMFYDERDLLFRQIRGEGDPAQSTTQFDYDGNGNLTRENQGLEGTPRATAFAYDGFNRRTTTTDAMGNVTTWRYDAKGNTIRLLHDGDADQAPPAEYIRWYEHTWEFDPLDRPTNSVVSHFLPATQAPIGDGQAVTRLSYAGTSQLLAAVDDNNRTNRFVYDRANRLQAAIDAAGNSVSYTYDANSNPLTATSVEKSDLGNPDQVFTTRYAYDNLDRLIRVTDNVSNAVQYAYDSRDNLVLLTDALGFKTRYEYDGLSRQITILQDMNTNNPSASDAADIVVRAAWDDSSRLVQRTEDNTNTTTHIYDALDRRVSEVLADGTSTTNTFDPHDNVVTVRDANGNAIALSYDLLNRVTNKVIVPGPGVSPSTTFERLAYDGLSRLVRAQDDDSLIEFRWDSMSNVERELVDALQTIQRTHDGVGNALTCAYPSGRRLTNTFDALNRLASVADTSGVIASYKYLGPDRVEQLDFANRTRAHYTYDGITGVPNAPGDFGVKRLSRVRHETVGGATVIDERVFTWDHNQNMLSRLDARLGGPGVKHDYAYDAADRLVRAKDVDPTVGVLRDIRYVFDGVGNRTSVVNNGTPELYILDPTTPDPADFQVNQYTATPFDDRQYDENGNPTRLTAGRATRQLLFDYANQLVQHADPGAGVTTSYAYDALGRRIAKTIAPRTGPAQTTRYFWSEGRVAEEQDPNGATLATYVYGETLDEVLQAQRGGSTFFYHADDRWERDGTDRPARQGG